MYLVREKNIKAWRDYNNLKFIECACKFTSENYKEGQTRTASKRKRIKDLIAEIKKEDPQIEQNIFKSVENVNLSTIIAYKDKQGITHHFKDEYDK